MDKSDKELIQEILSNSSLSQQTYEELVNRYKHYVFNHCFKMLRNKEDAEDATQEVFVRVYFGLSKFRFDSEFKSWLTQISKNVVLTMILSEKRKFWKSFLSNDDEVNLDLIYRTTVTQEQENNFWEKIGNTLYRLIQSYRIVFILKYFKAFNLDKISKKVNATLGATKMRVKRAKEQFVNYILEDK